MCTLLTVTHGMYGTDVINRILEDSRFNDDGFALLLLDAQGGHTILRTMDVWTVFSVLDGADWERMFLHSRYSTQGKVVLQNTHGWEIDGTFYMHNGCLSAPEAAKCPVDSQAIGFWLRKGGPQFAVDKIAEESFANVFLVNPEQGWYSVSRSIGGSLHTDGEGNYSTEPFAEVCLEVTPGVDVFQLDLKPRAGIYSAALKKGAIGGVG